jgi:hypothetical protein
LPVRQLTFLFVLVAALAAASVPLRAQQENALPPGDGRDIVAVACSQCHGLNAVTQLRMGAQAWRHQVDDMIQRGAQISPSEIDTVVNYLSTKLGPGVPFPGQTPAHVALPAGKDQGTIEGVCSLCHGLDRVVAVKRSRGQWEGIVNRMIYLGAPLSADQAKAAVDYLSTNFGT